MKRKIIIFLICFIVSLGTGFGFYLIEDKFDIFNSKEENVTKNVNITTSSLNEAVEQIYDAVFVVEGYKGPRLYSTGSGFVYKLDNDYAYILTNEHVVANSTSFILMNMKEEETEAELLGSDPFADLAVLRIDKKYASLVATTGSSENLSLGDITFTVGSPVGREYFGTVTRGIVSGVNRLVEVSVEDEYAGDWIMKVIQTDASINPGNSGGPLCNASGEVIGINTLKYAETEIEGMGFAIPIEYAMAHVDALEKGEEIDRPLLGVSMINLDDSYSLYSADLHPDESIKKGVIIENVVENSPADKAQLKRGDIILKIGNEELKNVSFLRYVLYKYDIGDTITVTYFRDGEEKEVEVILDQKYGN